MSSKAVFDADSVSGAVVSWSMTGTSTLGQRHPKARLCDSRVKVETYSVPPRWSSAVDPLRCWSVPTTRRAGPPWPIRGHPRSRTALANWGTRISQIRP